MTLDPQTSLAGAALAWLALHVGVAGTALRTRLVERVGERGFAAGFSALSLASFGWLLYAYRRAPCDPLWVTPRWLTLLPLLAVPVAFVFLVGAFVVRNPTAVGGRKALERAAPATGFVRVTRHPFLWAVMLWSAPHLIVNGNRSALLLFGTLLLTAAIGTRDIDRKRQRSDPEAWKRFAAVTSNLPFAAIVQGKNRLVLRELVLPIAVGLALAGLTLYFHFELFGLSATPWLG
jgi:uncharacterized membrane protein